MFQDTLRTEHLTVLHAVELDLFRGMCWTVLNLALGHLAGAKRRIGRRRHRQSSQYLIVNWQLVRTDLMCTLVVRALDDAMLG